MNKKSLSLLLLLIMLILTSCEDEAVNNIEEVNEEKEEVDLVEEEKVSKEAEKILNDYLDTLDLEDEIKLLSVKAYSEEGNDKIYKISLRLNKDMDDKEELKDFTEKHSELIDRQLHKKLEYERSNFIWTDSKTEDEEFEYIYYK